jgi:hypothetical protein
MVAIRKQAHRTQNVARYPQPEDYFPTLPAELGEFHEARGKQEDPLDRVALEMQYLTATELLDTGATADLCVLVRLNPGE